MAPSDRRGGSSDYKPVTDLASLAFTVAIIKRDVREIKPQVQCFASDIAQLRTDIATQHVVLTELQASVKSLGRPRPHDCEQVGVIDELESDAKKCALERANYAKDIAALGDDVNDAKTSQSKFIYWLLGAAIIVIGAAVGWVVTLATVRADVQHLQREQSVLRSDIVEESKATRDDVSRQLLLVKEAVSDKQLETLSVQPEKTFDAWYAGLSPQAKAWLLRGVKTGKLRREDL